jgi:hypothetical protein
MVHQKGLEAMPMAAAMGFVMGGSFAALALVLPAPLLIPTGAFVGLSMSVRTLIENKTTLDELWANRREAPEKMFSHMMCIFGDVAIGEVVGPLVGAMANKGMNPNRVKAFEDALIRFLKDESGTARINLDIESWKTRDTPAGSNQPGNFSENDVAFGLSSANGNRNALQEFAGDATLVTDPFSNPKFSDQILNATSAAERNNLIAQATVDSARAKLKDSGGRLRFNLEGMDPASINNPGHPRYNSVTSNEARLVMADPFLSQCTDFY